MSFQLIPVNPAIKNAPVPKPVAVPGKAKIRELCDLAARGLVPMFDPGPKLFFRRFRCGTDGMIREGISYRYTFMALLGLLEYQRSGGVSPIPVDQAIDALFQQRAPVDNIGDLGLLVWLCAKGAPERIDGVYQAYQVKSALERYGGAHDGNSMELSWFLTGLAYAAMARGTASGIWADLAYKTYDLLRKNQGGHGFFGHIARRGSLSGMFRGCVGSFADQVYPILALSTFSLAFGDKGSRTAAIECAAAICKVQGSLGQWWWHYDAGAGHVVQRYPVYSVHQHAMAPMALIALKEQAGCDFSGPMFRGLNWVFGANELGTSMCDDALSVIWRAIQPQSRLTLRAHQATAYLRLADDRANRSRLKILLECWPYELGWLLYAFSNFQF